MNNKIHKIRVTSIYFDFMMSQLIWWS